jgi:hypothetical protein
MWLPRKPQPPITSTEPRGIVEDIVECLMAKAEPFLEIDVRRS